MYITTANNYLAPSSLYTDRELFDMSAAEGSFMSAQISSLNEFMGWLSKTSTSTINDVSDRLDVARTNQDLENRQSSAYAQAAKGGDNGTSCIDIDTSSHLYTSKMTMNGLSMNDYINKEQANHIEENKVLENIANQNLNPLLGSEEKVGHLMQNHSIGTSILNSFLTPLEKMNNNIEKMNNSIQSILQ